MKRNKNIYTFIGCDADYEVASVVLFGAPFDGTTSFRPGTRFAPNTMREESYGLETYSPYIDRDLGELAVFDAGDIEFPFGNPAKVLEQIEEFTQGILADNKIPLMLGGEHLVTLGAIRAVARQYPDLHIVHFDAHTDLREDYLGETLSHASVIRRVYDIIGDGRIYQFGIRSGEKHEFEFAAKHTHMHKFDLNAVPRSTEELAGKPVYVTIDLDVLDPSVFPGTGTPEPGGVTYKELQNAIEALSGLDIVGWDIVELSPHYDSSGISTAAACKTVRETLLSFTKK